MAHIKIGFHAGIGGNNQGISDYFARLDAAGIPFSLVSADEYGVCLEATQFTNADHVIVFRRVSDSQGFGLDIPLGEHGAYDETAAEHKARYEAALPPEFDKDRVWLGVLNEPDHNRSGELARFALDGAQQYLADGYKTTWFGWAGGTPEPIHWEHPDMLAFLRFAAEHRDSVSVAIHEYAFSDTDIRNHFPFLVGRYQALHDACDKHNIAYPTVIIKEWGWGKDFVPEPDSAIEQITDIAALYAAEPNIIGAAIWYLGDCANGAWRKFGQPICHRTQRLIAPLTDAVLDTSFPDPAPIPEPDPAPEKHTIIVNLLPQDATLREKWIVLNQVHALRQTIVQSADDARYLMERGNEDSLVKVWNGARWADDIFAYFAAFNIATEAHEVPPESIS